MRSELVAIFSAAGLALFIGLVGGGVSVVAVHSPIASSSGLAAIPAPSLPAITLPAIATSSASTSSRAATQSASSQSATKPAPSKAASAAAPAQSQPQPAQSPSTPSTPPANALAAASNTLRAALVNILCLAPAGSAIHSISGSGVIISPAGYILTNAHIGQYFLLADHGVSCVIRAGSPAQAAYTAAPVFVSPAWIAANPSVLEQSAPTGTGEHDIALLAITGSATSAALPASFPFAPLEDSPPVLGESVVIGSYAAQFLQSSQIESALFPTIVYGAIESVFTFDTNTIDVVSLGGNAAAQEGSSGGGAIDGSGELSATITTSTTQGDTSARQLDAISATYIRRDYAAESGSSLDSLLAEPPSAAVSSFAPQIPALESQINLP